MRCFCISTKKDGSVLLIVGIIIIVLAIFLVGAGIYFYNYYVFETARVCIGEPVNTEIPCENVQNCIDLAEENGISVDLSDAPAFIQENFQRVIDAAVYCDGTCFVKKIRGINYETLELEMLKSCEEYEVEIVAEIHGNEAIETARWMRSQKD